MSLNLSPAPGFLSGWYLRASLRYADLSSLSVAVGGTSNTSYKRVSLTITKCQAMSWKWRKTQSKKMKLMIPLVRTIKENVLERQKFQESLIGALNF